MQNLFLTGKKQIEEKDSNNPLNKNMPPIAAMLNWTDSLKTRITEPIDKFYECGKRITEKEEFSEIDNSYHSIHNMINEYGSTSKTTWDDKAKSASGEKQRKPILTKLQGLITVNFDPELLQLLKEVKYLKILNMDIPAEADEAYKKNNEFRNQIANLNNIKSQYNTIISTLNDVEKPILHEELHKIEISLEPALTKITWEDTKAINEFTSKAQGKISELAVTVEKLKLFVTKLKGIFKEWNEPKNMLFQKPEG